MHLFGQDVLGMVAGEPVAVTTAEGAVGYPARTLEDVEPGNYYAQAVLVTYETFNLTTGHTVKLPTHDRGDGQHWVRAPGNLYSTPRRITVGDTESYELSMSNVNPVSTGLGPSFLAGRASSHRLCFSRSRRRPTRNTSSTSAWCPRRSRPSGAGRCGWERSCSCRGVSTSTQRHATQS